jgi:nucleoside phosphorylase
MGKASAAAAAAHCRSSFPNIKLALVVGVCGAVPYGSYGEEIVLGDVLVSEGVVQRDLGRQLPDGFVPKREVLDSLHRPNSEIRGFVMKLKGINGRNALQNNMARYLEALQAQPELAAQYPRAALDRLFEAAYAHAGTGSCEECGCNGPLVPRARVKQGGALPVVHFGLIASTDTVMKSGRDRDAIAEKDKVIGFEMESAGVWDSFPCVVIKGACDYADSHKAEAWQRYAAATAAACMKAFLKRWPSAAPGG